MKNRAAARGRTSQDYDDCESSFGNAIDLWRRSRERSPKLEISSNMPHRRSTRPGGRQSRRGQKYRERKRAKSPNRIINWDEKTRENAANQWLREMGMPHGQDFRAGSRAGDFDDEPIGENYYGYHEEDDDAVTVAKLKVNLRTNDLFLENQKKVNVVPGRRPHLNPASVEEWEAAEDRLEHERAGVDERAEMEGFYEHLESAHGAGNWQPEAPAEEVPFCDNCQRDRSASPSSVLIKREADSPQPDQRTISYRPSLPPSPLYPPAHNSEPLSLDYAPKAEPSEQALAFPLDSNARRSRDERPTSPPHNHGLNPPKASHLPAWVSSRVHRTYGSAAPDFPPLPSQMTPPPPGRSSHTKRPESPGSPLRGLRTSSKLIERRQNPSPRIRKRRGRYNRTMSAAGTIMPACTGTATQAMRSCIAARSDYSRTMISVLNRERPVTDLINTSDLVAIQAWRRRGDSYARQERIESRERVESREHIESWGRLDWDRECLEWELLVLAGGPEF